MSYCDGHIVAGFPDRFRRGDTEYWLFGLTGGYEEAVYVGQDAAVVEVYRFDSELVEQAHERYPEVASTNVERVLAGTAWASLTDLGSVYLEPGEETG